jgi:signal transduction histidine kinase
MAPGADVLRAQLDALMEVAPAGLWISDDAGCERVLGNAEAYRQLRMTDADASGMESVWHRPTSFDAFIDGRPIAPRDLPMQQAAREGRTFRDVDLELRFKDGSRTHLRVSCVPVFDAGGRPSGMVAWSMEGSPASAERPAGRHEEPSAELARRTSELRETYDRVRDFERLALTGTIASGLGHDLGNLLLPLRLRLDALRRMTLPNEARSDIAAIEAAVNHLQHLSAGLRWLAADSGTGTDGGSRTRLRRWIQESEQGFRELVPSDVRFAVDIPSGLPAVRISHVALTHAISNLVQNAGQALRGRHDGVVQLSASLSSDGDAVQLSVSDNGPGLDEEGMERCFEPFFTTRKRQISTGLGLAVVRSLARRAGGDATVVSSSGEGATFTFTVPVARSEVDTGTPALESRGVITVHGARQRALFRTILTHDGFGITVPEDASDVEKGVWVSDLTPPGELDSLRSFVEAGPQRWALVVGHQGEDFGHSRIIHAGAFNDIPALRAALEHVIQTESARAHADV